MDAALIVSAVSLVAALAMSVVTWRVVREDRRRSAARVMALANELAEASALAKPDARPRPPRSATRLRGSEVDESSPHASLDAAQDRPHLREPAAHVSLRPAAPGVPNARTVRDGVVPPGTPAVTETAADLFASAARPSTRLSPPVAALLAALAISGALVIGLFALRDSGGASLVSAEVAAPTPLELVALRHSQDRSVLSVLTVSGLVRNPPAGSLVQGIAAVVLLFDRSGAFLASGRAPLEVQALKPGDAASFVVKTSVEAPVGRYRISFRREDDAVLPHVDRRDQDSRIQGGKDTGRQGYGDAVGNKIGALRANGT